MADLQDSIVNILGGKQVVKHTLNSVLDYVETARSGLPKKSLVKLQTTMGVNISQMAQLVGSSPRSLARIQFSDTLPIEIAEPTLQIAQVVAKGIDVFGDEETFREWMSEKNMAMAGNPPIDLLNSRFGAQLIMDVIGRIEWGDYS